MTATLTQDERDLRRMEILNRRQQQRLLALAASRPRYTPLPVVRRVSWRRAEA
ncbi:hypothetical protein [Antribacter gilvus]|uniref:hypothetical protein n=1 Tax=Antribacter gilvus TaxID=2304675 RepID=UPI0013DF8882|nr:hypothetical protein [Antribacter gilvus]